MTLRESLQMGRFGLLSHDRDRLILALDTLEAVEWVAKNWARCHIEADWLMVEKRPFWRATYYDPGADRDTHGEGDTLSEAVSKLRAAMKEGT